MNKLPSIDGRFNQPADLNTCSPQNIQVMAVPFVEEDLPVVDTRTDGLVDQDVYQEIVEAINTDTAVPKLKIYPGIDGYWCYLKSFGDYISIDNSVPDELSLEINESRLYTVLSVGICPGNKGKVGDDGLKGPKGLTAPEEPFYDVINGEFCTYVPTPIGTYVPSDKLTNISIRFYSVNGQKSQGISSYFYWSTLIGSIYAPAEEADRFNKTVEYINKQNDGVVGQYGVVEFSTAIQSQNVDPVPILELHVNWDDGSFVVYSNDTAITEDQIEVSVLRDIGCLKVSLGSFDVSSVLTKIRQMGMDGVRGDVPTDTIRIVQCDFDQTNVRPDNSLINVRMDCNARVLYTEYGRVSRQEAYRNVTVTPNLSLNNTEAPRDGNYLSVPISTSDNRKIALTSLPAIIEDKNEIVARQLVLPTFAPEAGCPAKYHEGEYDFDWVNTTDIPACDDRLVWFGLNGIKAGKYPFDILRREPVVDSGESDCCQDDFYYFPDYNC